MKVSICIPTYNQGKYIELAVRSAEQQTLTPIEIIVSNDCSTDNSKEVLDRLEKEISILKVVHQPVNLGIAKNVDICLRLATGNYVIRLDSDDWLMPQFSEKLVHQLESYPSAGYAHAAVQEIDQLGNTLRVRKLSRGSGFQSGNEALKLTIKGYKVAANILMFKREALEKVNFVSCNINFAEDYYMVSAISAAGFGNVYVNEILSNYRVWVDIGKVRQKRKLVEIAGLRKVAEDVLEPAFRERNWSLSPIKKMRTSLATHHASCLGWNVYSKAEKEELLQEIYHLSSSKPVKIHVWLYLNGLGLFLTSYFNLFFWSKSLLKNLLFKIRS